MTFLKATNMIQNGNLLVNHVQKRAGAKKMKKQNGNRLLI